MKKKSDLRQNRDHREAEKKARYRQAAGQRQEQERSKTAALESQRSQTQEARDLEKIKPCLGQHVVSLKSSAKAAGLKSNFILSVAGNHLLMTSFGKGNQALLEKDIQNRQVTDLHVGASFTAVPDRQRFLLNGRISASTDDPLYKAPKGHKTGDDLIHSRAMLESRFFGTTFDDNIHIQLIYNILDVEKLLTAHINNIIYALNNLLRGEISEHEDLIGYSGWHGNDYASFIKYCKSNSNERLLSLFQKLARQKQLGYYGICVMTEGEQEKASFRKQKPDPDLLCLSEAEFYTFVSSLGQIRQALAHGDMEKTTSIYTFGKGINSGVLNLLTRLYQERVNELNDGFVDMAQRDLVLLFRAFDVKRIDEKKRYVQDYYNFIVRKQYKNQGFSVKKLREAIPLIIEEAAVVKDARYDTVRQKVNRFFDFAVYRYYRDHSCEADALVESLRSCRNDDGKLSVYSNEARRIWPLMWEMVLDHILPNMSGNVIRSIVPDKDVSKDMLDGVLIPDDVSSFSKLIYMMTIFMDGKEINDLLTSLINKLENIGSFLDVLKDCGLAGEFKKEYALFVDSWNIADELRTINSFARMRKESPKAKPLMLVEAARVLGDKSSPEDLEAFAKEAFDTGDKGGGKAQKKEMGVRNFIINNVIDTPRFRYLARYADIDNVSRLAKSEALLTFVLRDIPDNQILRYYNACFGGNYAYDSGMRGKLVRALKDFSFAALRNVRNNDKLMNAQEQEEKRQKQALVRLYLTVLYLAVKNLVYVNSRYFMAFHCLARDRMLQEPEKWVKATREQQALDPAYGMNAFAADFLQRYPQKPRVQRYLEKNFANSDSWAVTAFRNKVEHLDAVRSAVNYIQDARGFSSWFDLYHYIMQRTLIEQFTFDSHQKSRFSKNDETIISKERLNPKMLEYSALVIRYGTCCHDAVKALCVPFAYNLPRYKNLTIEGLFDKNRPGQKGEGRIKETEGDE